MQRREVDSSNVRSLGFEPSVEDAAVGELEIVFHSGHTYRYADVPRRLYEQALHASSVGQFVARNIVGKYQHERV